MSFTLSLHSLCVLPVCVMQHGGLAFLLVYLAIMAMLCSPLLLLEVSLCGELCLAMTAQAGVRAWLAVAQLMWATQAVHALLSHQDMYQGFFSEEVLGQDVGQLSLVLAAVCVTTFILVSTGTRAVGKVCLVAAPTCFLLLATLTIRTCLAPGGGAGILTLLTPDWGVLAQPAVWLEAMGQAILSLQLGIGAVTAYTSYNSYRHNILQDCAIIIILNTLWVILAILFTFSLLGAADGMGMSSPALTQQVWLASLPVLETVLAGFPTGWLWACLFFLLIILVSITSLFGYLEVIISSLLSHRLSILPCRPVLTLCTLTCIFLLDLGLATQGGVLAYQLVLTFLSTWPCILFSLLVLCQGSLSLVKNISSSYSPPHWLLAHISVAYTTTLPACLLITTIWSLYSN